MNVQYYSNPPNSFPDLLRKRSVFQEILIGHSIEPKVSKSSHTPESTPRHPRRVVCKICRQLDKWILRYAPETNCPWTTQPPNIVAPKYQSFNLFCNLPC